MRKLRLEIDELAVESFDTARTARGTGTVRGASLDGTYDLNCPQSEPSDWSCPNACYTAFTNCGGDTCDRCYSFITDSPQRCPTFLRGC